MIGSIKLLYIIKCFPFVPLNTKIEVNALFTFFPVEISLFIHIIKINQMILPFPLYSSVFTRSLFLCIINEFEKV